MNNTTCTYTYITHLPPDFYTEIDSSLPLLKFTMKTLKRRERGIERSGQNVKMNEKKVTVFQANVLIII